MDIQHFITSWLAASNAYDTQKYLEFYLPEAVLDDPSIGRIFEGHQGVKEYFNNYFIGYQTQTRQLLLDIVDDSHAHLEVEFTGDFPEGIIGGIFDFTFKNNKIVALNADLKH